MSQRARPCPTCGQRFTRGRSALVSLENTWTTLDVCGECAGRGMLIVVPDAIAASRAAARPMAVHLRKLAKAFELDGNQGHADGMRMAADIFESGRAVPAEEVPTVRLSGAESDQTRENVNRSAETSTGLRKRPPVVHRDVKPEKSSPSDHNGAARVDELTAGERRILTTLVDAPQTVAAVALVAKYSKTGGAFTGALGRLGKAGYLERRGNGDLALTPAGREALGPIAPTPVGPALLDHWERRLGTPAGRILRFLVDVYPGERSREEIAAELHYEVTGGAFTGAMGKLRRVGLLAPGRAPRAADALIAAVGQ